MGGLGGYYIIMEGYYYGILLWDIIMGLLWEGYYGILLWLGFGARHNIITHNCYIALFPITFYTPITELLYRKYKESPTIKPGKLLLTVHNISYS